MNEAIQRAGLADKKETIDAFIREGEMALMIIKF